jgi:hypothetical protein
MTTKADLKELGAAVEAAVMALGHVVTLAEPFATGDGSDLEIAISDLSDDADDAAIKLDAGFGIANAEVEDEEASS